MWRKRGNYKFQGCRHSKNGIISMLCSFAVIITFLTISILSGMNHGNGSLWLGLFGMAAFFLAVFGFVTGIKSFKEKDIFYIAPVIGVGINGVMLVTLFCLYIVGIII